MARSSSSGPVGLSGAFRSIFNVISSPFKQTKDIENDEDPINNLLRTDSSDVIELSSSYVYRKRLRENNAVKKESLNADQLQDDRSRNQSNGDDSDNDSDIEITGSFYLDNPRKLFVNSSKTKQEEMQNTPPLVNSIHPSTMPSDQTNINELSTKDILPEELAEQTIPQKRKKFKSFERTTKRIVINPSSESEHDSSFEIPEDAKSPPLKVKDNLYSTESAISDYKQGLYSAKKPLNVSDTASNGNSQNFEKPIETNPVSSDDPSHLGPADPSAQNFSINENRTSLSQMSSFENPKISSSNASQSSQNRPETSDSDSISKFEIVRLDTAVSRNYENEILMAFEEAERVELNSSFLDRGQESDSNIEFHGDDSKPEMGNMIEDFDHESPATKSDRDSWQNTKDSEKKSNAMNVPLDPPREGDSAQLDPSSSLGINLLPKPTKNNSKNKKRKAGKHRKAAREMRKQDGNGTSDGTDTKSVTSEHEKKDSNPPSPSIAVSTHESEQMIISPSPAKRINTSYRQILPYDRINDQPSALSENSKDSVYSPSSHKKDNHSETRPVFDTPRPREETQRIIASSPKTIDEITQEATKVSQISSTHPSSQHSSPYSPSLSMLQEHNTPIVSSIDSSIIYSTSSQSKTGTDSRTSQQLPQNSYHSQHSENKPQSQSHSDTTFSTVIPNSSQSIRSSEKHVQYTSRIAVNSSQESIVQASNAPFDQIEESQAPAVIRSMTIPRSDQNEMRPEANSRTFAEIMKERFEQEGIKFRGFGIDSNSGGESEDD